MTKAIRCQKQLGDIMMPTGAMGMLYKLKRNWMSRTPCLVKLCFLSVVMATALSVRPSFLASVRASSVCVRFTSVSLSVTWTDRCLSTGYLLPALDDRSLYTLCQTDSDQPVLDDFWSACVRPTGRFSLCQANRSVHPVSGQWVVSSACVRLICSALCQTSHSLCDIDVKRP